MKIFKFGGASVKDAPAIRNISQIIKLTAKGDGLVVVLSAMGKTTDLLEEISEGLFQGNQAQKSIKAFYQYHADIIKNLFKNPTPTLSKLDDVTLLLQKHPASNLQYDPFYDQIVSQGEILSSIILSDYLADQIPCQWIDARDYISTNQSFREAKVDWAYTRKKIHELKDTLKQNTLITQGFIGRADNGLTTTLGREGSDYTAAVFGACLDAETVTIWKDVPGVMNADPKRLPAAMVFSELPFQEAAEMAYYGASIIHPKTIKPLANANIPLFVKNFDDPSLPGTKIHECKLNKIPPLTIFKENQCLVSCKATDYTFITEDHLSLIFKTLSEHEVKLNMMQNSAISFSFCTDFSDTKIWPLIEQLGQQFEVHYNTNLTLITIKNYSEELSKEYRSKPGILLEQLSRSTLQLLIREHVLLPDVQ